MKRFLLLIPAIIFFFSSCEEKVVFVYPYNYNPVFTWVYAEYFGKYYENRQNPNQVISLNLFSDSLEIDSTRSLVGTGQYLYFEDIFMTPGDTLLPAGNYAISNTGNAFTIYPGKQIEENGTKYDVGAYIYFIEKNNAYSVRKFITGGNMQVSYADNKTIINFNFQLIDSVKQRNIYVKDTFEIKGKFEEQIPYFDFSTKPQMVRKSRVQKPIKIFSL